MLVNTQVFEERKGLGPLFYRSRIKDIRTKYRRMNKYDSNIMRYFFSQILHVWTQQTLKLSVHHVIDEMS